MPCFCLQKHVFAVAVAIHVLRLRFVLATGASSHSAVGQIKARVRSGSPAAFTGDRYHG